MKMIVVEREFARKLLSMVVSSYRAAASFDHLLCFNSCRVANGEHG